MSRQHGVLRWGATGWEFENAGSAPTFVGGQQVTRVLVDRPLALALGLARRAGAAAGDDGAHRAGAADADDSRWRRARSPGPGGRFAHRRAGRREPATPRYRGGYPPAGTRAGRVPAAAGR